MNTKQYNSVYGWLNHEAKTWWANKHDRARQRAQIRNAVKNWRRTLDEKGFVKIAYGGISIEDASCSTSGCSQPTVEVALRLGVPVIDLTAIPIARLSPLSICGPMATVDAKADPAPWGSLDFAPISVMAAVYANAGAKIHNIDPDYTRAKFTNFKMKLEVWAEILPPKLPAHSAIKTHQPELAL